MSIANKNLLGSVLLGAALFLFWMLDLTAYQDTRAIKAAIAERKTLFDARKATIEKVAALHKDYAQKKNDIERFSAVVPAKKSVAEAISEIEGMVSSAGAQIVQAAVTPDTSASNQGASNLLSITLTGKGSYLSLVSLLDAMEKNIRLLDVNSIDATAQEAQANVLTFTIKAKGYYLK